MIPLSAFFVSLATLLVVARKSLWIALWSSALLLGAITLSPSALWRAVYGTLTDPAILMLALAVAAIPMIGGIMEDSGMMDRLVNRLPANRRIFLLIAPSLVGLLPMPGGALLSAPIIERGAGELSAEAKTAINVWFRHVLLLVYPLGALLATTKMARVDLYTVILTLSPGFLLMFAAGTLFTLRNVHGSRLNTTCENAAIPLLVILLAPALHFLLLRLFPGIIEEIPLLAGVSASLVLALRAGRIAAGRISAIARRMKPWSFALIILGMFLFLSTFTASEASEMIARAAFSPTFTLVVMGGFLGFATGRVQVPVFIVLPIFIARFGPDAVTPLSFALLFFSAYQGYVISPVHPCLTVTLQYYHADFKAVYRILLPPALLCWAAALVVCLGLLG